MGSNPPLIQEDDVFSSRDSTTASQRASSSRLHFSAYDSLQHRHRSPQKIRAGLSPPVRRGSPLNPQNVIQTPELRRRPWPPDATHSSSESPPRNKKGNLIAKTHDFQSTEGPHTESEVGAFSNEYDLAHEDPRILQDVQRALKLKARREARLKREPTVTPERASTSYHAFPSSYSESSPEPFPTNSTTSSPVSASPNLKSSNSTSSEVDFSPSTGISDIPAEIHPAPTSFDHGNTLDWSCGASHEREKSWTKSIVKKKQKGIVPPLGIMVDQQEQLHKEKLARISNLASAQTLQKAHMTREQLDRRYNLIFVSLRSKNSYNVAKVARWYSSQPDVTQRSLERLEPFTWLKHLEKRSGKSCRSPWNLTALIMEEFVQAHKWHMETIPEDSMLSSPILLYRKSPPSFPSSPPKAVPDGRISFEPLSESNRNSWDAKSYKSAESASSVQSGSPHITPISPVSSQLNDSKKESKLLSPFVEQTRPRKGKGLFSDESEEDRAVSKLRDESKKLTVPEVYIQPPPVEILLMDGTKAPAQPITLTTSTGSSSSGGPKQSASPAVRSLVSLGASLQPKQLTTAPVSNRLTRQGKKYRSEREKQLRREYEAKSLLLSEAARHNSKIRQLLNRLSTTMKDFDSLQNITPENVRGMLPAVPKELVEAFGHDPAGVTGPTRRLQGWRAVEDIHHRVHRQQHTFKSFLDTFDEQPLSGQCALDKPIEILEILLDELENEKAEITANAESVSQLLKATQEVHAKLKDIYNKMVSHVSVVYPQLSHIVALEESYKDQYQQFWELGMDALTLLLDTVTPFWRTYGKTIGEDVRDFLIIPLYRNEFTGESKRYRIKEFPKRSWQRWLGLVIFFLASIGVNILQIRAAISSTLHFRLSLIPYDGVRWTALPFFWISIVIQWFAVLLEFAIVFMELGVVVWWSGWTINLIS